MKLIDNLRRTLRRVGPLAAVVGLGLLATVLSWQYLRGREQELKDAIASDAHRDRIDVVVPVRPLAAGELLRDDMVARREVPTDYVYPDALQPDGIDAFIGRKLTLDAAPGRPLLASFFSTPQRVFAEQIEPGVRAMTIAVDEISSISGMLRAGDRIDFMYLPRNEGAQPGTSAQDIVPLLQDVQVRATGQITAEAFAATRRQPDDAPDKDPYRQQSFTTVTVALPQKESQMLILAQRLGSLIAVLRNPEDRQTAERGMTAQDLADYVKRFGAAQATPAAARTPGVAVRSVPGVEFIVGDRSSGTGGDDTPDLVRQALRLLPSAAGAPRAATAPAAPIPSPASDAQSDTPPAATAPNDPRSAARATLLKQALHLQ